jgi:3'-5' exoribonuclease
MKDTFISDFKPGDRVTSFFIVRQKQLEPFRDKAKGEFLTLSLADRTGQVLARVWDNAPTLAGTFEAGDVLKIAGDVEEYQGRMQLIVQRLRPATDGEYDLSDFVAATTRDVNAMLAAVQAAVVCISDPHLSALVRQFYGEEAFLAALAQAPATRRLHHAYLGGWLEHLTQILALCNTVLDLHPELNADLLRAGALLLSAGKLREHSWAGDIDYTDEGRLLGHVVLADEEVNHALAGLPEFPPELALRVRHILLSHRGRYEWGSPRPPMTLEAIALHQIETLNAQLSRFRDLLNGRREPNQPWTEYNRLLGRPLYAGYPDPVDTGIDETTR